MAEGIDLTEWRKLNRDLREFKPDKQLKKTLRGAGERIAEDARKLVGPFSQTIPGTIKISVRKTTVTVSAGGGAKALAREMTRASYGTPTAERHQRALKNRASTMAIAGLFERGNKGRGHSGSFRHPIFGREDWTDQPMHPYLGPAREKNLTAIEHLEGEAVVAAFREVGWHGA